MSSPASVGCFSYLARVHTINDPPRDPGSILGPSLRFKGELYAEEDLVIRGRVEGSIKHTQRLTVGREGLVKADIYGQIIAVQGTVDGDLHASTSVSVAETGRLVGDIHAPSVSIVEGADFNGSVLMDYAKPGRSPLQTAEMSRKASER